MTIIRRRWADSCRPFNRDKVRLPRIGVNWKGYVYIGAAKGLVEKEGRDGSPDSR